MKTSGEVNCRKGKKRKTPHKPQHLRYVPFCYWKFIQLRSCERWQSQPNSRKQRAYSNAKKSGEVNCKKDKKRAGEKGRR